MTRSRTATSLVLLLALLAMPGCVRLAAQSNGYASPLTPYRSCQFSDELKIVQVSPMGAGVTSREVDTDSGPRRIGLLAGIRVMLAYPDSDFYANVKAEWLPRDHYAESKQALLDNFKLLSRRNRINTALPSPFHGFEAHGLDRKDLEGGVLGVYLLFDDATHVVTTAYLLNQDPSTRKFQTMQEYAELRDRFLNTYATCVRRNQTRGK